MSLFLGVPLKKTSEVELTKFLQQQLSTFYGSAEGYAQDIEGLNKLRKESTYKGIDGKSQTTLNVLQRYYDQLKQFTEKCPINDVPINFKWKDSFEKDNIASFLGGSTSQIIQSLSFEKICVLFNVGACLSEIAASLVNEDYNNEHALQVATKNFQLASGIFLALKSEVPSCLGQRCNHSDLNPNVLNILHMIMLAQAQEALCIKATNSMSDGNISKVASQCADYYAEANKLIQVSKTIWPAKEWINHIQAKQLVYTAIADYHQSVVAKANKKYGEEISWLKHSVESLEQAEAKESQSEFVKQYEKKATRRCEEAIKENDFIYHARVPEYRLLDVIDRFSLVKPMPLPARFTPEESGDLFSDLLPLKVQQGWHKLEARKQEIVSSELSSLTESTANLNAILANFNLPAAIEDAPGVDLPQSLKDKSKYVKAKGGFNHVSKLISELPDLFKRNMEIIEEIENSLRKEELADNVQREKYGKSKWSRKPSSQLNKAWKDYVEKYKETIKNARLADDKVKDKFRNHETEIRLLSSDDPRSISEAIPTGYEGHDFSTSPCVSQLRKLMSEVEKMKKDRESLEEAIKQIDIQVAKKKFESAAKTDGTYDEPALIAEILGELFGPLQRRVRETRDAQDLLVKNVSELHEDFVELRGGFNSTSADRDKFFTRLAVAHDAFNDLLRHLQEGTKFYNDLTNILVNIQTKVDDYCLSRQIEHDELIKSLGDTPPKTSSEAPKTSSTPSSSNPAVSAPSQPAQQPHPYQYFPPPPLPTMPYGYGTYHPHYGYGGYQQPPYGQQPPYNPSGYNTMPPGGYPHQPPPPS